jgi:hypothetical protein
MYSHMYVMEYYSASKRRKSATCNNMDKTGGHCSKSNKPVMERQILDNLLLHGI